MSATSRWPGLRRSWLRWRRDLVWRLRGRGGCARVRPLDELLPCELEAAVARGRELAGRFGW